MELLNKPDWEITATTIYCNAVDDEVTLIVYADGTSRCTGRQKYARSEKKKKNPNKSKNRECTQVDCPTLSRYRESLINS
jgi:hypothetical protein